MQIHTENFKSIGSVVWAGVPLPYSPLRLNKTVKKWRNKSQNVEVKTLFAMIFKDESLFNESVFIKTRNYLNVEIIIPNAERFGIISGLLVK